jgi:hypothetical protein
VVLGAEVRVNVGRASAGVSVGSGVNVAVLLGVGVRVAVLVEVGTCVGVPDGCNVAVLVGRTAVVGSAVKDALGDTCAATAVCEAAGLCALM